MIPDLLFWAVALIVVVPVLLAALCWPDSDD